MSRKGQPITSGQPVPARRKYKIDAAAAQEMRRLRQEERLSYTQIARRYSVHHKTVMHWVTKTNYLPLPWVSREVAHA